jgi:parallel beta-helix repeat protein
MIPSGNNRGHLSIYLILIIIVAQCFWAVSAQIAQIPGGFAISNYIFEEGVERQRAIDHALAGFSECDRASKQWIGSQKKSDVPPLPDKFGELSELSLSHPFNWYKEVMRELKDRRSLLHLFGGASAKPSTTGMENPWVAHTLGAHGSLDAGLQSSRELDLAIKVAKEKEKISPARLFDLALDVTNGDKQSALLTCHNLLKEIAYASRTKNGSQKLLVVPVSPKAYDFYKEAYEGYFTEKGLKNFLVTNNNGNLEIALPADDKILLDKLENIRPRIDRWKEDNIGPWYHIFGVMFVASVAGSDVAYNYVWWENTFRLIPGTKSPLDPFKMDLGVSAAYIFDQFEGSAYIDCVKDVTKNGLTQTQSISVKSCINHAPLKNRFETPGYIPRYSPNTYSPPSISNPGQLVVQSIESEDETSSSDAGRSSSNSNIDGVYVRLFFAREPPAEYKSFNTIVRLNGHVIGRINGTVPKGNYVFRADPAWLNYAERGAAANTVTLDVEGMNRGYYVPLDGYKIDILFKSMRRAVCASSQEEADKAVLNLSGAMLRQADLTVTSHDLRINPQNPVKGENVAVEATIRNLGSMEAWDVEVQILDNDRPIFSQASLDIAEYSQENLSFTWQADAGVHNIKVVVNPGHGINESSYENNEATRSCYVKGPDSSKPTIGDLLPPDGSVATYNMTLISADLADEGSGVNISSVSISVDEIDVTDNSTVIASRVWYTPKEALSSGSHRANVTVEDNYGNMEARSWSFRVSSDSEPPEIMDLQPLNGSAINETRPPIGASLKDEESGVNISSVSISVDGIDVTDKSTITATSVQYTPGEALSYGSHIAQVTVEDNYGNEQARSWSFNLSDSEPPEIMDLQPQNGSTISEIRPLVGASLKDEESGVNISSVSISVDEMDVTDKSIITATSIQYTPKEALSYGSHTAQVIVQDNYGNEQARSWSFNLSDSEPPEIMDLQPQNGSTISEIRPLISATLKDEGSGVDSASVVLIVDGSNVTEDVRVYPNKIWYTMHDPLAAGEHSISLRAEDLQGNAAERTWSFLLKEQGPSAAGHITVCSEGCDYTSIQKAVNAASPGAFIEVRGGTYRETVNVTKPLTLQGIGFPVVDAGGKSSAIALSSDGIVLQSIRAENASLAGIYVHSNDSLVKDNEVKDNRQYGIYLCSAGNNTIENNKAIGNGFGFYLGCISLNNTFSGNTATGNGYGLFIELSSSGNILQLNKLYENKDHNAYDNNIAPTNINKWNSTSVGNYYGDSDCVDSNGNGICDRDYAIPGGGSVDWYPLRSPNVLNVSIEKPPALPAVMDRPPEIIRLASNKTSPQIAGTAVAWKAEAIDPEKDEILYRFFLNGPSTGNVSEPETGWTADNTWTWNTSEADIGEDLVEVRVRDGKHAEEDSFDDRMSASFIVRAPALVPPPVPVVVNKTPAISSLTPDKSSPLGIGTIITWTSEAIDPDNDPIQYRFFLDDQPQRDWSSNPSWIWTTSTSDVGSHSIDVRVRDGKHASPDGFDDRKEVKFELYAPVPAGPIPPGGKPSTSTVSIVSPNGLIKPTEPYTRDIKGRLNYVGGNAVRSGVNVRLQEIFEGNTYDIGSAVSSRQDGSFSITYSSDRLHNPDEPYLVVQAFRGASPFSDPVKIENVEGPESWIEITCSPH